MPTNAGSMTVRDVSTKPGSTTLAGPGRGEPHGGNQPGGGTCPGCRHPCDLVPRSAT